MRKVLLTGASGRLGAEIKKIFDVPDSLLSPSRSELDLANQEKVDEYFRKEAPEIVIHCAANTDLPGAQTNPGLTIRDNVVATSNLTLACIESGARLVFVSTSHVFDGKKGDYKPQDPLNPLGNYAKSKAAAELVVRMHTNSLTIRVEFFGRDFPYASAFDDKFATKLYSDEIAPKILAESLSNKTGIMHLDIPKRSIYEIAMQRNPEVKRSSVTLYSGSTPNLIDTSLIGGLYVERER